MTKAPADQRLLVAQLVPGHRALVEAHLLALAPPDRRLRFGTALGDASIRDYVRRIRFFRDATFGAFDADGALTGFAHLAFTGDDAELAVSVAQSARGRGVASALLIRAREHARNRGYRLMHMIYLPENTALARLAKRAGMHLVVDAVECRAWLALDAPTAESLLRETARESLAALDLGFRRAAAAAATSA